MKYFLAVDQSTSATKAFLFDHQATLVHRVSIEHLQYYPRPGWVEHDALQLYQNTVTALNQVLRESGKSAPDISSLSITNQRETVVAWDLDTGLPVYNALVWQDERGQTYCEQMESAGHAELVRKKTGLVLDSYFSASKLRWLLEKVPEARKLADNSRLACGTIDSWLIWKLTSGNVFACDSTNASRTMLFDIHRMQWDAELLELWGLATLQLPEVKASDAYYGTTQVEGLPGGIPICGVIGDSHAALVGQGGFAKGTAKVTYGTGSSAMINVGTTCPVPPKGIVAGIGWHDRDGVHYALEGNIHHTGDTLRWARDEMQFFSTHEEAEKLAVSVPDSGGIFVVPAFTGLGAPHWKHGMRALITGLARNSDRAHLVRAVLESIPLQINDLLSVMSSRIKLREVRVDGGPSSNAFLMQLQADLLEVPVLVASTDAASARGAVFLAGRTMGIWPSIEHLVNLASPTRSFKPSMRLSKRMELISGWHSAIKQTLSGGQNRQESGETGKGDKK